MYGFAFSPLKDNDFARPLEHHSPDAANEPFLPNDLGAEIENRKKENLSHLKILRRLQSVERAGWSNNQI